MSEYLSAQQLGAACRPPMSERNVRRLARRNGWPHRTKTKRGTPQLLFKIAAARATLGTRLAMELEKHGTTPAAAPDSPASPAGLPSTETAGSQKTPAHTLADLSQDARLTIGLRQRAVDARNLYTQKKSDPGAKDKDRHTAAFIRLWNAAVRGELDGDARRQFEEFINTEIVPGEDVVVSRTRLYEWSKGLRQRGIIGLGDGRQIAVCSPAREKKIPAELWLAFKHWWLDERQISVQRAVEMALSEFPSEQAKAWADEYSVDLFRARVRDQLSEAVKVFYREGKKAYNDKCQAPILRDRTTLLSNQLWISDHHELDVMVYNPSTGRGARPWLTVWQDGRSNKIVSWVVSLEPPNQYRVTCSFADAVLEFGLPNELLLDNGRDYRSRAFSNGRKKAAAVRVTIKQGEVAPILKELEIVVHWTWPYNARSKPTERWFKTLCERFEKTYPSYWGNRPENRPTAIEAMMDTPERLPSFEHLAERLGSFIYEFDAEFRSEAFGLDGKTADEVFAAHRHTTRMVDPQQLMMLLMPSKFLKVNRDHVQLNGRWYRPEGAELTFVPAGTMVRCRYNPRDLRTVFLFNESDKFICSAIEQSRVGFFNDDDARKAIIREKRITKAIKKGHEAEFEKMSRSRDALEAYLQEQRDASLTENHRQLQRTGTDDQPEITPERRRIEGPSGPLRLANIETDASGITKEGLEDNPLDEFLDLPPDGDAQYLNTETNGNDWMDSILDDADHPAKDTSTERGIEGLNWQDKLLMDCAGESGQEQTETPEVGSIDQSP